MPTIQDMLDVAAYTETTVIANRLAVEKEHLLRKILNGESITDKEDGFLDGIAKAEQLVLARQKELVKQSKDEDDV